LRETLASVGSEQDQVIEILENLLGDLSQWDSYRRFAREISRIRREQQTLTDQTDQLRLDTLGQQLEDLSPQNKAALSRQTERQAELARRLDKTLSRMDQMRVELAETEPLAAEMLADALHLARQAAISGQMREGGRQIEGNQVGQAVDTQRRVERALEELIDVLSNRREQELDRRVQGLQEAGAEIERLRRNLDALRQQLQKNQQVADDEVRRRELERLAQQAEPMAEEARRLADVSNGCGPKKRPSCSTVPRLTCANPLRPGNKAWRRKPPAGTRSGPEAGTSSTAARSPTSAGAQDLLQEQMARLQQQIESLVGRQQGLLETTTELESLRSETETPFTDAQLTSLRDLARAQRVLGEETTGLAAQTLSSPGCSPKGSAAPQPKCITPRGDSSGNRPERRSSSISAVHWQD
jgi:hypothetical protein